MATTFQRVLIYCLNTREKVKELLVSEKWLIWVMYTQSTISTCCQRRLAKSWPVQCSLPKAIPAFIGIYKSIQEEIAKKQMTTWVSLWPESTKQQKTSQFLHTASLLYSVMERRLRHNQLNLFFSIGKWPEMAGLSSSVWTSWREMTASTKLLWPAIFLLRCNMFWPSVHPSI